MPLFWPLHDPLRGRLAYPNCVSNLDSNQPSPFSMHHTISAGWLSMSGRKILIDTNVFIGLEDQKEVPPNFAKLQQLCGQHSIRVFVHEAAVEDIRRDKDLERRKIS